MTSNTQYLATVDQNRTYTTIFIRRNGIWVPYDGWLCSVGSSASPTPNGTFKIWHKTPYELHHIQNGEGRGVWYWSNWGPDGEAFHSQLTQPDSKVIAWGPLGRHNTSGCVRCPIEKAKWVYDNVKKGTTVHVFTA